MRYIYADVLMITNFLLTYFNIAALNALTHAKPKLRRMVAGAGIGAAVSLLIVVESRSMGSAAMIFAARILAVGILVLVVYGKMKIRQIMRYCLIYLVISCAFAAVTLVFWKLTGSRIIYIRNFTIYFDLSLAALIGSAIVAYVLLWGFGAITQRKFNKESSYRATLTDTKTGENFTLPALADTGNALCNPFNGKPVAVCVSDTLSERYGVRDCTTAPEGFLLIPFHSLGGTGLIPVTGRLAVEIAEGEKKKTVDVCVGITPANGAETRLIFHPRILL